MARSSKLRLLVLSGVLFLAGIAFGLLLSSCSQDVPAGGFGKGFSVGRVAAKVEEMGHRLLVLEVTESPTYEIGSFVLVDFDSNWYLQGDSLDSVEPGDTVEWVHLVPGDSRGCESGWQFYLVPEG